ncbi:MAG TPA: dipicolinate synthase subunit B [Candidatus Merdenecus merdavium]|nr:dipicolinate synthase subunit B [Candidatus Merdenecus merdavium]
MSIKNKTIGFALTGSFCTFEQTFPQIEKLVEEGATVQTIFSKSAQTMDSRFGKSKDFMEKAKEITGLEPILDIPGAEPIGPKSLLDVMVILPCTGNTIAKLANGITDGPVLMAAKAHLRNSKPLVVSISTNDALGMNMKNIGLLLNSKFIYFVPFGQDNVTSKPNSLVAHPQLLLPTIEAALKGKQYQPVIQAYLEGSEKGFMI